MAYDDPLWNEFYPLWTGLRGIAPQVLVAGGYGLFLKQLWLQLEPSVATIIPLQNWRDPTPRTTKDLDLVLGLEILGSTSAQQAIAQVIQQNQFMVVDPRWQFKKMITADRIVLLDLHAELPPAENPNLINDKLRVKHRPSLGDQGVHGRKNPEAAGSDIHPCQFVLNDLPIAVPNPITWSIMKLAATRDRLLRADDTQKDETYRTFHRLQATKHVNDVARVIAMTTREESDRADGVVAMVRNMPSFAAAVESHDQLFAENDGWGTRLVGASWSESDLQIIRATMSRWFRS